MQTLLPTDLEPLILAGRAFGSRLIFELVAVSGREATLRHLRQLVAFLRS